MDLDKIQIDNDYENKEISDAAEYVTRLNELDNGIKSLLFIQKKNVNIVKK